VETVGREAALERGAGARSVSREWTSGRGHALSCSVGGAAEGEKGERGGGGSGRGSATRRGTASWGLTPTGGRRPDRVPVGRDPDATRVAVRTTARWRRRGRLPVVVRAGRREWRVGARGPVREENGVVEPGRTVTFSFYSN
jgi:hypothetical protein